MRKPGVYNIKLQRRADCIVNIVLKDSTGTPLNLTGWTALAQVWNTSRTTKYADFTVTYVNRSSGSISISLSATQTAGLPTESQYDLMLINTSGVKEYYLEGTVTALEGYTAP